MLPLVPVDRYKLPLILCIVLLTKKFCPYKLPLIPTPPATVNAPEVGSKDGVELRILIVLVVLLPRLVTVSNVLVFQITICPVAELTAVSVPALISATPLKLALVRTALPPTYMLLKYASPPTPSPPSIITAPEVVPLEVDVL